MPFLTVQITDHLTGQLIWQDFILAEKYDVSVNNTGIKVDITLMSNDFQSKGFCLSLEWHSAFFNHHVGFIGLKTMRISSFPLVKIRNWAFLVVRQILKDDALNRLQLQTNLNDFLLELMETHQPIVALKHDSNALQCHFRMVQLAKQYIDDHIHKTMSIKTIACQVGLNETYLKSYFKVWIGQSIKQYILNRKIELAKTWLLDDGSSIGDVSNRLGFSSMAHFSKTFKTITGQTAVSFKKKALRACLNFISRFFVAIFRWILCFEFEVLAG